MNIDTINRIEKLGKTFAESEELIALCGKYSSQALQKRYELDIAGVPFDSELRVFEVMDEEWIRDMGKLGFNEFMGLTLKNMENKQ
jgi:hypothetical protein